MVTKSFQKDLNGANIYHLDNVMSMCCNLLRILTALIGSRQVSFWISDYILMESPSTLWTNTSCDMCAADVERTQIWSSSFWQLLVRPRCILHCRSLNYPLLSLLFSNIVCLGTSPSSAFFLFAPYDLFVEIGTLDFLKTLGFFSLDCTTTSSGGFRTVYFRSVSSSQLYMLPVISRFLLYTLSPWCSWHVRLRAVQRSIFSFAKGLGLAIGLTCAYSIMPSKARKTRVDG